MITIALCMIFIISNTLTVMAASKDVTYQFVDSNEYEYIGTVTKASETDYASVKITKFYKANGDPTTSYKKAYFQLGSSGNQASSKSCEIDKTVKFTLKGTYNKKGTVLTFYAMGNDASLDCYVDATLNADVN